MLIGSSILAVKYNHWHSALMSESDLNHLWYLLTLALDDMVITCI